MLIIGAGGFAKQLLDVVLQSESEGSIVLYDDLTKPPVNLLYNKFQVIHTEEETMNLFKKGDRRFVIGVGKPQSRALLYEKFTKLDGDPFPLVSKHAHVSSVS